MTKSSNLNFKESYNMQPQDMAHVGEHETSIINAMEKVQSVRYHSTDVVRFTDDYILLNTGGWFTQTTKRRMNQASLEYGLGFNVYQKNHVWYATHKGKTYTFNGNKLLLQR